MCNGGEWWCTQDMWRDASGRTVDRATFMVALHNVQHWLIKVADTADSVTQARSVVTSVTLVHFTPDKVYAKSWDNNVILIIWIIIIMRVISSLFSFVHVEKSRI